MAKDPAMLFYTADFLTGVTLLSMRERGQLITLLCLQQQMGHMSLRQMEKAAGKLSPALLQKFVRDGDGLYYNRRTEEEIGKRKAYCGKQKENVRKRWAKDPAEGAEDVPEEYHGINHGTYHGITAVIPLENENGNENGNENESGVEGKTEEEKRGGMTAPGGKEREEREAAFAAFWAAYPRKVGKQAARKAFAKVPRSVWPRLAPALEAQKRSRQWQEEDGRYVPYPATWLGQGRWEDGEEEPAAGQRQKEDLNALLERMERCGF